MSVHGGKHLQLIGEKVTFGVFLMSVQDFQAFVAQLSFETLQILALSSLGIVVWRQPHFSRVKFARHSNSQRFFVYVGENLSFRSP